MVANAKSHHCRQKGGKTGGNGGNGRNLEEMGDSGWVGGKPKNRVADFVPYCGCRDAVAAGSESVGPKHTWNLHSWSTAPKKKATHTCYWQGVWNLYPA